MRATMKPHYTITVQGSVSCATTVHGHFSERARAVKLAERIERHRPDLTVDVVRVNPATVAAVNDLWASTPVPYVPCEAEHEAEWDARQRMHEEALEALPLDVY